MPAPPPVTATHSGSVTTRTPKLMTALGSSINRRGIQGEGGSSLPQVLDPERRTRLQQGSSTYPALMRPINACW